MTSDDISGLEGRFLVMVSTGKDSIAMVHKIIHDLKIPKEKLSFVYMYFYPKGVIEYRDNYIKEIESIYGIEIHYSPHYESYMVYGDKPKISFSENREFLLKYMNCNWYFYGWWKGEGLATNIMLKHSKSGVPQQHSPNGKKWNDPQNHLYPLHDMNENDVWEYIKKNDIHLAPEYDYGYRDIAIFRSNTAKWLHDVFPEDYKRAIEYDKNIELDLFRCTVVE